MSQLTELEVLVGLERLQSELMSKDADIVSQAMIYLLEYRRGHAPEYSPEEWESAEGYFQAHPEIKVAVWKALT